MDLNNIKHTWLEGYPISWKKKKVKHLFLFSKDKIDDPQDYPILSLTMKGIKERDISKNEGQLPDNYIGYSLLQINDIVFNPMDLISGWVDKSNIEGIISPSYKIIRPRVENISVEYYKFYFQMCYTEKIFFPFGEGVHYQYRWGLGNETLMDFPILQPPYEEQQTIVKFLDEKTKKIEKLIKYKEQKIELLKEKRSSLINVVMTKGLNEGVEMKDSEVKWIGDIPNHWLKTKIKYYVKFDSGYSFKSEDYQESGIPLLRIGSLYMNKLSLDRSPVYLSDSFLESHHQFVVSKGDILISMTGTLGKRDYGYSILYDKEFPSLLNQRVGRMRLISNKIDLNYLMYSLLSESYLNQLFSKPSGTKQGNLSSENIVGNYFGLPEKKEQILIVQYLNENTSEIDKLILMEEQKIESLKEYKKSLIFEIITGKVRVLNNE